MCKPVKIFGLGLLVLLAGVVMPAYADVCAVDDLDKRICLPAPAQRIATLSPGATELVYAAGAGKQVVAVVAFSDYPPQAKQVQSVGSHTRLDLETLVSLKPDLAIGWVTGNPPEQLESLAALGIPVFHIEPHGFEAIASVLERLAVLAGTEIEGKRVAEDFRRGMADLEEHYADAEPVSVFYQVWNEPLMTANDGHFIGRVIRLCGGINTFGDLPRDVPRIDLESVLATDPEVIVVGGMGEDNSEWLIPWRQFSGLKAVQRDNLFFVPPSLIQRPTPRLLEGSRILCQQLDRARARR